MTQKSRRTVRLVILGFCVVAMGAWSIAGRVHASPSEVESSNPLSGDEDAIETGAQLFAENCTLCHGRKANGKTGRWASADLTKYRKGYTRFLKIVQKGVEPKRGSNNQMPPWEEFLDETQIGMIGAYLETLAARGAKWVDPK